MDERASSVSYETRCGGVLESMYTRGTPVVRDLSGASGIATEKVIPHMVAELWLRTPLH